jgi:hypothetical protein
MSCFGFIVEQNAAAASEVNVSTRREFVKAAVLTAAASGTSLLAEAPATPVRNQALSQMRGFNYQPSYGSCGFELWQNFEPITFAKELGQGKQLFPRIGAIRLWLSWDSFIRNPALFKERFDRALQCASSNQLAVMPVLFNRWHDYTLDYGGIYIDQILLDSAARHNLFQQYLEAVVGNHADDKRIFAWDLCNEPMLTNLTHSWTATFRDAEYAWLEDVYQSCKQLGAKAPLCISTVPTFADAVLVEPISDILAIHPYWIPNTFTKTAYEKQLDSYVELANRTNKPLLATENCWGSLDDKERVQIIRYTLGELKSRGIGWLAYLLHFSLIADAHGADSGPVGSPGNLSFIQKDGTLRPGHEIFNDY